MIGSILATKFVVEEFNLNVSTYTVLAVKGEVLMCD